jgi:zinc transporter
MLAFLYSDDGAREVELGDGAGQFGHVPMVWLHLDGRADDARRWVAEQADIPEIARAALLASETRPRSDLIGHGAIINLRGLGKTPEDDPDALVSIRFWAEQGRVVSLGYRSSIAFDDVRAMFLAGKIKDPGDLLSTFAGAITDGLDPEVAGLGDVLDTIETELESEGIYTMRRKVGTVRSDAIGFRRFVSPQRQALERLATADVGWLDDDDRLHLREAADRFARMAEELEAVRERAAIVHEELTDLRAEQMDARGLVISIVALIFLPLTFITGLFGMNVPIPDQTSPYAFWVIVGGSVLLCIVMALWFVRHRWLGRN